MSTGEFSVYQWLDGGIQEKVRAFVDAEEAMSAAQHYTTNVSAALGLTMRVIITDSGDSTVFEWKKGEGVVFPEEYKGWQPKKIKR